VSLLIVPVSIAMLLYLSRRVDPAPTVAAGRRAA